MPNLRRDGRDRSRRRGVAQRLATDKWLALRAGGACPQRNRTLVLCQPGLEILQRRIERPGKFHAARTAKIFLEVALELKHIAQIIRARKSQSAVDFRG